MHIRDFIKNRNWQSAIRCITQPQVWSLCVLAVAVVFFSPSYNTNDDVSMARMASGAYDGVPNPRLIYIHSLYGLILSKLYAAAPIVPWYGLLFLILLFFSLWCTTHCIQSRYGTTITAHVATLYATVVAVFAGLFVQYTTIASFVAMSGFIVLIGETLKSRKISPIMLGAGIALVVTSFLIRENVFLYAAVLAAPLVVHSYITSSSRTGRKALALSMGGIVVAVVLLRAVAGIAYSSTDWNEYMRWSSVQAFFHAYDITSYQKNKEYYTSLGWSENDHTMLNTWFYTDAQRFSIDAVSGIIDFAKRKNISLEGVVFTLKTFIQQITQRDLVLLVFIAFQLLIIVSSVRQKKSTIAYGITIILCLALIFYFSFLGRLLPDRLLHPLFLMVSMYGLFVFLRVEYDRIWLKKCAIGCAALLLFFAGQLVWYARLNGDRIVRYSEILKELPKGSLIFNWDSSLPMQWTSIFDTFAEYQGRDIAGTGWVQRSPYDSALFKRYGIRDLYSDMIDNPRVYLVALPQYIDSLRVYMREHYHREIRVVVERNFDIRDEGLSPPLVYTAQLVQIKSVQE